MRNTTRVWIDTDNDMEEEETREQEVNIHKEMAGMVAHEIAEEISEVENKERSIKER
jgi:hypothetical protein